MATQQSHRQTTTQIPKLLIMTNIDYLIVGSGPAGLQLGYFFQQSNDSYVVLERGERVSNFMRYYPKRRELISFNKINSLFDDPEINLRWDWNSLLTYDYSSHLKEYTKELLPSANDLTQYLEDFADRYELNIHFNRGVSKISKMGDLFKVEAGNQTYMAKNVIMSTGVSLPYIPPIKGIENVETGYENFDLDKEEYRNKRVLVIGKGNSAFEITDYILDSASLIHMASPTPLRFGWDTKFNGHTRAVNTRVLDTYQLKLLNGVLNCEVLEIEKKGDEFIVRIEYNRAQGEIDELVYDKVIRCTGFRFDTSMFDESTKLEMLKEQLPNMTPFYESTNQKGIFFAGTLTQARDFQCASSTFIGGFRYNVRFLYKYLKKTNDNTIFPHKKIKSDLETLFEALVERICKTSALWSQFEYLVDFLVLSEDEILHFEEVPKDYLSEDKMFRDNVCLSISYEWGSKSNSAFHAERDPRHESADRSAFLHPVIRLIDSENVVETHHMLEDLYGVFGSKFAGDHVRNRYSKHSNSTQKVTDWHREQHDMPLRNFLKTALDYCAQKAPLELEQDI